MRLEGVQYLRGFAAFAVVLFHIAGSVFGSESEKVIWVSALSGGVDVFFVISGFIIWQTTLKPVSSPWQWWRARLVRVVPLYWLALLACLAIKAVTGAQLPAFDEALKAFSFIPAINSVDGTMTPFLQPGWTLNYEFTFYALTACTLFLPRRLHRALILAGIFVGLMVMRRYIDPKDAIQFRMTSPLFLEFIAGICVAEVSRRITTEKARLTLGIISFVSSMLFLAVVTPRLFPDGPRFIYFGGPAALLVAAFIFLEQWLRQVAVAPLRLLGDASYSLYLSHPLVLLPVFAASTALGLGAITTAAIGAAACVAMGIACFAYVERPLLSILNHRLSPRAEHKVFA